MGVYNSISLKCPICGSENIFSSDGHFMCLNCSITGNDAELMALRQNISYDQAMQKLGLRDDKSLSSYYKALNLAADYYHRKIFKCDDYLKSRLITSKESEAFSLGFANGYLWSLLKKKNLSKEGIELGLLRDESTDKFFNRLMFPIMDDQGRTVGFGGRRLSDNNDLPKYINTAESLVFHKQECLFGIQNIKADKPLYIVEGYLDALALQSANINAVAILGTALTMRHALLLNSLGIKKVFLALDNDEPGRKNTVKALKILKSLTIDVEVFTGYKNAKDADEFLKKFSAKEFLEGETISGNSFLLQNGAKLIDIL